MLKAGLVCRFGTGFIFLLPLFLSLGAQTYAKTFPNIAASSTCRESVACFDAPICMPATKIEPPRQIQGKALRVTSPVSSPKPTNPQSEPTQIPTPSINISSASATLDADKIFELVNQYRASHNLPPFELNDAVCELAKNRSMELGIEIAKATIHAGLYARNLPYWIWENAKAGSNEEETVAWWLASPIHRQSIVGDYKYSCVKCQGTNCSQLFTSFSPK